MSLSSCKVSLMAASLVMCPLCSCYMASKPGLAWYYSGWNLVDRRAWSYLRDERFSFSCCCCCYHDGGGGSRRVPVSLPYISQRLTKAPGMSCVYTEPCHDVTPTITTLCLAHTDPQWHKSETAGIAHCKCTAVDCVGLDSRALCEMTLPLTHSAFFAGIIYVYDLVPPQPSCLWCDWLKF